MLYKSASTGLYPHQAVELQGTDGLAQGVAVDAKAGGELVFAGQSTCAGKRTVADFGAQRVGNLLPDRHAAAASCRNGLKVFSCHRLVMLSG